MIGYDIDGGASPFEVVSPPFESVVDSCKLLIMDVVIGLGVFEHSKVEHDRMVVTVWGADGWYCR